MAFCVQHSADVGASYNAYLPTLYSSNDGGESWFVFDEQIAIGDTWVKTGSYVDVNIEADQYIISMLRDTADANNWPMIYEMPIGANPPGGSTGDGGTGQVATSPQGDVTSMTQIDLDDEDAAVIQGSTRGVYRLDRDNGVWTRVTANSTETVDNGTASSWFDSGDIPPLSVHPDSTEYVAGVTIDGTYGANNWIFRNVEAQGKTMLLGTNGQCFPICYHASMNGGFARRMGEVPPSDPNDLPAFDPLDFPTGYLRTGNLAPKAKCMAVGANRVLLANLVGGSPYGIDVSAFNDPDRGWGLEQFVMLGDTPGGIVSMNEISALAIAVYKTDAIYQAVAQTEFAGVAAPFRFELSKAGVAGPCSPAAVVRNHDGRQVYLARDGGVYMYDGVAPIDVGRNIRRMIQDDIDYNSLDKVWGMADQQRKLIWFFYPTIGGVVNKGVVCSTDQGFPWPVWSTKLPSGWNFTCGRGVVLTKDLAVGQLGPLSGYTHETLGSFSSGEQTMLMGTLNNVWVSQKWKDDGSYSDDGIPIPVKLHQGWISPTNDDTMHTADEIYHLFASDGSPGELTVPPVAVYMGGEQETQPTSDAIAAIDPPGYIDTGVISQELTLGKNNVFKVQLKADQIGNNYRMSQASELYIGKLRHRTRHRVSGTRFALQMEARVTRFFTWAGGILKYRARGKR
jgi:hypothetical protein